MSKIYPTPKVDQTPMSQRNSRWGEIKGISGPLSGNDPKTFDYWFNYFWEEARQANDLSTADQGWLCTTFFAVMEGSNGSYSRQKSFDQMPPEQKRGLLDRLLQIGFKRVPLEGSVSLPKSKGGGSSSTVQSVEKAVDAALLFAEEANLISWNQETLHIGFRGDGRAYETIVDQGGLNARARSFKQDVYKDFGFNMPWNPFSLKANQGSLFLRKGINKDNCIHTVVSVASQFHPILPYPLLSDPSIFSLATTPFDQWPAGDSVTRGKMTVKVSRSGASGPIDHIEDAIRIFVLRVDEAKAFDTEAWQGSLKDADSKPLVPNPFPERAVDAVPTENVLAEISLTRHHFFNNGVLQFYDFTIDDVRPLPSKDVLDNRFGVNFTQTLLSKITQVTASAKRNWFEAKQQYDKSKAGPTAAPKKIGAEGQCPYCDFKGKGIMLKNHITYCDKNPANI